MKRSDARQKLSAATPPPAVSLLESMAESRISVLYLARRAKEAKNTALAKELSDQGQRLRTEITRLRQTETAAWGTQSKALLARAETAQSELAKLIRDVDKSAKKMRVFTRALAAASNILAVAKKVI